MIRTLTLAAGLAISAGAAQGAFVGIQFVEGDSAGAAAFAGAGAITFQMFALFDGAGGSPNATGVNQVNTVLSTGFVNIATVGTGTFFTVPGAAGGGITPPSNFIATIVPATAFMTFGTVGALRSDDPGGVSVGLDPDAIASGISPTLIEGGWFTSAPPLNVGAATANAALSSGFGTLLFNITISTPSPITEATVGNITSLITGSLSIFETAAGGALEHAVVIPTPGAMALFGIAGLAATRRRR